MNSISGIILIFFLISILIGWIKGLFKTVLSVAGLIVGIVVAVYVSPHVSGYLQENTQIDENLAGYITQKLELPLENQDNTRASQVAAVNDMSMSEGMKSTILDNNNSEIYKLLGVTSVYDYIAKSISIMILNAITFLILLSGCRVIFFILSRMMGDLTKLPIVRSIDKIGGGCLGCMKALIYVWVFFLIVSIAGSFEWCQDIMKQIEESALLKLLYDNNLILDVVGDLGKILFR